MEFVWGAVVEPGALGGLFEIWRNAVVVSPWPTTGTEFLVGGWDGVMAGRL